MTWFTFKIHPISLCQRQNKLEQEEFRAEVELFQYYCDKTAISGAEVPNEMPLYAPDTGESDDQKS